MHKRLPLRHMGWGGFIGSLGLFFFAASTSAPWVFYLGASLGLGLAALCFFLHLYYNQKA